MVSASVSPLWICSLISLGRSGEAKLMFIEGLLHFGLTGAL